MKKIILGKVDTNKCEIHFINQFDDVKIAVRKPIYENKQSIKDVEKEIDGEIVMTREAITEQVQVGEEVYYTLPDGTIPSDIDKWQAREDPIVLDGWVVMKQERPSEGDWIASKKGKWVKDISQIIAKNEALKTELMQEAVSQISLLQDIIDLDMQESNEVEQLKEWKKYRILLTRVDASDVNALFPEKPNN